jgi:hypothetical protein
MTRQELRSHSYQIAKRIVENKCYVKGYGRQFRIVDKDHNPILNIEKPVMNILLLNNVVRKEGLIHVLNTGFVLKTELDIEMPKLGY